MSSKSRKLFLCRATGWLRFLGRLQLPPRPRPYADQIDAFADYLVTDQGLSEKTSQSYCLTIEPFLDDLLRSGHTLQDLTITQIDEALIERITRQGYTKTRILVQQQQVVRIDREVPAPLSREMEERLCRFIDDQVSSGRCLPSVRLCQGGCFSRGWPRG